jgi:tryptophan-rich sensory protein
VALCLAVGAIGGLATSAGVREWYPTLAKPSWTPPNWVFAPVWTTLYVLMGVAGWLVYRTSAVRSHVAWRIWWIQLALNAFWSPVFFGAHLVGVAAAIIAALWLAITWFIVITWRPQRAASRLFLPYWTWVTYASSLNFGIWWMN